MADEIRVSETFFVRKVDAADASVVLVHENSQPTFFTADLTGDSGPYVGTLVVNQTITKVNLDTYQVSPGGMMRVHNQSDNVIFVGIYVQEVDAFFSLEEILPGEFHRVRLSRYLGQDTDVVTGTGTGSTAPGYLAFKASAEASKLNVKIFPP